MQHHAISRTVGAIGAAGAVAVAATGLAGWGGSHPHTFKDSGMDISFVYPSALHNAKLKSVSYTGGAAPAGHKVVGIDRLNLLLVEKSKLTIPTTKADLPTLDLGVSTLMSRAAGHPVRGRPTSFRGVPAVAFAPTPTARDTTSQISFAFVRGAEYELDCQWTAEHASAMKQACRQMKSTIRRTS